mmetsp:Transcript_49915/g.143713  ORF Transcript_49915/g.143713 Transcript_49915/m.143713 type:complete len:413 (-) Transcript_49915:82-1320(-)
MAAVVASARSSVRSPGIASPCGATAERDASLHEVEALIGDESLEPPLSPPPAADTLRQLGKLPPAPFFPKGPRAATRSLLLRGDGESGVAVDVLKGAELRMRRLEQEISDLREAYARKISNTELKCESLLRAKDKEMGDWYKEKKSDIGKMQASLVIMRGLYTKARERFKTEAANARQECQAEQDRILEEAAAERRRHREAMEKKTLEMEAQEQAHRQRLLEVERERDDLQSRCEHLETQLAASQRSERSLRETSDRLRKEGEELRKRVTELEASDELQRKNAAIEALEQELKRSKKQMQEKNKAESEALRKELMDYVRFIVNILPDNLQLPQACGQAALAGDELQSAREFRQRMLARHQQQSKGCRGSQDLPQGMLPPVVQNAAGHGESGSGGGGAARLGAMLSARGGCRF